jgi:hypothetical protein
MTGANMTGANMTGMVAPVEIVMAGSFRQVKSGLPLARDVV